MVDDSPVGPPDTTLSSRLWPWAFVPVLVFQGALLHPCLRHSRLARVARILAAPYVVYSALALPLRVYFTPAEYNVASNLSVVGANAAHLACLGVHWGAVPGPYWRIARKDRTPNGKPWDAKTLAASPDYRYPGVFGLVRFAVEMFCKSAPSLLPNASC